MSKEQTNNLAAAPSTSAEAIPKIKASEPQRINVPVWQERDPREVINPEPGMRYYWLDDDDVKKGNLDGWDIDHGANNPMKARSANPNSNLMTHASVTPGGTEVRAGTMVLGKMPEEMALLREKHYLDKGNAPLRDLQDVKQAAEAMQEKLREQGILPDLIRVSGGLTMNRR